MTEERITERVDATGNLERTVERGSPTTVVERRSGMGALWIVLLLALLVGGYFLLNANSETRKDDAVAAAAKDVGDGAKKVGDAAEKAADDLTK